MTTVTAGLGFARRARRARGLRFQRSPRSSRGRVSREGRAAMVPAAGAARVTFSRVRALAWVGGSWARRAERRARSHGGWRRVSTYVVAR